MKKAEQEYIDRYGDIPEDQLERLIQYIGEVHINDNYLYKLSEDIKRIQGIKWDTIRFIIYMLPKATPRPRHTFLKNTVYVMGAKDNKDIFRRAIVHTELPIITTPCKIECVSYLPIPSAMNGKERILAELGLIYPIGKPDWDNLAKTYSDMIQGTLLFDDALIIEGVSKKFYSLKPRIEITLKYMKEYDSQFNEKKMRKKVDRSD